MLMSIVFRENRLRMLRSRGSYRDAAQLATVINDSGLLVEGYVGERWAER